ncbi:hypothetical protein IF188_01030 [Microbacterium sp. NEAU-LLC]|uniref:CDP-alcohol phosphatidyltransferase n=1 Tax=Microbacterium helvum TaxID=2773713 RepID=A0ABR8NKG6_9MICO|nr:hypothetical protein [Microbacterium helvum]MBD3940282.1 hypothetical protein [Microbacterium helvum]
MTGLPPSSRRRPSAIATTAAAIAVLVVVPLIPGPLAAADGAGGVRIPVESLAAVLLLAIVPWRPVRVALAAVFGAFVTLALVLAGIDRGYQSVLGIHFIPLDWPQLGDAYGVVVDAAGPGLANLMAAGVVAVIGACVVGLAWAALRIGGLVRRRADGRVALAAVAGVWIAAAAVAPPLRTTDPVAAAASVGSVGTAVTRTVSALEQQAAVARDIAGDPFAGVPAHRLLTALRGKDVLIVFVESYGRVALEDPAVSPGVIDVLQGGDAQLAADGYIARSAWLTSPTFGGRSWLAHSTLQSGVWIDTQADYEQLVDSDRLTLTGAFGRAGWRTVADVPSNIREWDVGTSFYGYDTLLGADDVGYRGPKFGYARVPDQYTLKHFADTELAGPHDPVMAEIDLVSSHTPWAPLPQLVSWDELGDGSVFDGQPARSDSASDVWQSPRAVQKYYGLSVQYSLGALLSFLGNIDDPDLVVLVLGDHQPASIVSGESASRDVPVTLIARDPAVAAAIGDWGWQSGLRPGDAAPVWRMDAVRDRFLAAFDMPQ